MTVFVDRVPALSQLGCDTGDGASVTVDRSVAHRPARAVINPRRPAMRRSCSTHEPHPAGQHQRRLRHTSRAGSQRRKIDEFDLEPSLRPRQHGHSEQTGQSMMVSTCTRRRGRTSTPLTRTSGNPRTCAEARSPRGPRFVGHNNRQNRKTFHPFTDLQPAQIRCAS